MSEKPDLQQEEVVDEHVASLEPNYIGVFWWLVALTVAEILVASMGTSPLFPQFAKGLLLIGLALGKAGFVALYFMHLKFEKRTLGVIALTPLLICTLLIIGLLPDLSGTAHRTRKAKVETVEQAANLPAQPKADN